MRRRSTTGSLLVVTALLTLCTPVASANTTPSGSVEWVECGDKFKGECATIPVPLDWGRPGGETINLAIGRLRATDPAQRIGVLLANPGGPGGSGITSYITGRGIPDDSELRKRFDIISWDPRGVERSNAVKCDKQLLGRAPSAVPVTDADFTKLLAYNTELGADCRRNTGPLIDNVDTVSTVRDMDAIRAALGEEKVNFLGFSYGTQIGQQYAELFGKRLRAMVIDSNMDHSIQSAYHYLETATRDLEGSFTEFADWCARTQPCALHGRDVREVWDGLYAKAEAGKLTDPASGKSLTASALREELFVAMYRPEARWFPLATRLAALDTGAKAAAAAPVELAENAYQAIWCQDWSWRVNGAAEFKSALKRLERVAPHTRLSPFWSDITSCLGWPTKVTNPQHRLSVKDAPPILMVASKYDVATPRDWNLAVAKQIKNAVLLHYDGVGHGQFSRSKCARGHIETYLTSLRLPAPNTHCAAEWPTTPPAAQRIDDAAAPRVPLG
ncbi:alpha/beta hydrolase [Allokutzneria albata]|uniref:Alpha/beta hydrolase fold n=1 Tax=Allokutzneria albata TaxID=211114 RepID=A0A1H0AR85_ALLAB|nr:alpha/beta hydrolase [Allokutzneria albata]SDN35875.1 alpha/beta hydrolase fold [Allokutzneria albata]